MQQSQLFVAVIINGSFVSDKAVPNDIDLILALKPGHVQPSELGVADYALLSRRRLHRRFGFDVLIAEDGSALYKKYVRFYSQLREDPYATKGILRIDL